MTMHAAMIMFGVLILGAFCLGGWLAYRYPMTAREYRDYRDYRSRSDLGRRFWG